MPRHDPGPLDRCATRLPAVAVVLLTAARDAWRARRARIAADRLDRRQSELGEGWPR